MTLSGDPCSGNGAVYVAEKGCASTPNFPNNYPNGKDCIYRLVVPDGHVSKKCLFSYFLGHTSHGSVNNKHFN